MTAQDAQKQGIALSVTVNSEDSLVVTVTAAGDDRFRVINWLIEHGSGPEGQPVTLEGALK